jgi:hypothetical protein
MTSFYDLILWIKPLGYISVPITVDPIHAQIILDVETTIVLKFPFSFPLVQHIMQLYSLQYLHIIDQSRLPGEVCHPSRITNNR